VYAAQVAQDSQCGYSCDYQNKRAPVSTNEVTEMMKGLGDLGARLRDEGEQSTKYVFGRFKKRLLSDCYGRGVTRSSVEAVSLLTQSRAWRVCAAESITTSGSQAFNGKEYVNLVERFHGLTAGHQRRMGVRVLRHMPPRNKILPERDEALLYGLRGSHLSIKWLSAHEFTRWVQVVPATAGALVTTPHFALCSNMTAARCTASGRCMSGFVLQRPHSFH